MKQSRVFEKAQSAIVDNWKKSFRSAIEKSDIVLSVLDHAKSTHETYTDILKKEALNSAPITMREAHQIIQKLISDKFIDVTESPKSHIKTFYPTIKSEFFILEEGYQNRRKKEN
jgi:hypothetical protein